MVDTIQEQSPQVNQFLQSHEFKNLVQYSEEVLKHDARKHDYFHGLINLAVEKYSVLNKLIHQLEQCKTMDEVKHQLHDFYEGRGKVEESPYEILEKGQNLSTRFASSFGLGRSETIKLIDKLAASIGIDNEVNEDNHFRYEL